MQHTALKQIKYNRGQVTDKLSERSDMGLQNACGVIYNDMYINRYGQLQKAPTIRFAAEYNFGANPTGNTLFFLFDTGTDVVIPVSITASQVKTYKALSKKDPLIMTKFSTAVHTESVSGIVVIGGGLPEKAYQFGSNIVVYGQNTPPFLIALIPLSNDWSSYNLVVRSDYFDNAFDYIFVRGLNTETPSDFTPATSGSYLVYDDAGITTKKIITVKRNGAGGAFTQSLVGQVLNCPQLSGAIQVREVVDANTFMAYVLSPLITAEDNQTQIYITFSSSNLTARWVFGYEKAFDSTNGYPDSVCYANQRLIFGGNDKWGNLIAASRVGVINDFDPSDATESDSFSASIAAPQYCRIVDFVQSNDELRIATTYGEYATSLSSLTPTAIIQQGFHLRSQVGVKKDTPICDCGGLTAYVSNDGNAIHLTQFSLLQNKYSPISLTSQTEGIINDCKSMVYLRNRVNDEGNCLVGVNNDGSVFVGSVDVNGGLNGFVRIESCRLSGIYNTTNMVTKITKIMACGSALWGLFAVCQKMLGAEFPFETFLVRFELGGMFNLPVGNGHIEGGIMFSSPLMLPALIATLAFTGSEFRALYDDNGEYKLIAPTGYTTDYDTNVSTLTFADDIDQTKILCAGFIQQSDWRSVELSVGLGTRELNKRIVKLSSVVEPVEFHGEGMNLHNTYKIPESDTYKFFNLVLGDTAPKLTAQEIDNPVKTIYTEDEDMSWRRGFDNPSRELHYGITMLAPFLIKSTTAVLEYDDVP